MRVAQAINSGNSGGPVVDSKGNCLLAGFGGDVGLLGGLIIVFNFGIGSAKGTDFGM